MKMGRIIVMGAVAAVVMAVAGCSKPQPQQPAAGDTTQPAAPAVTNAPAAESTGTGTAAE